MKDSISPKSKPWQSLLAVYLWVLIWYAASWLIQQEMVLASPISVARQLLTLMGTASFWHSVGFSLSCMGLGFVLAFVTGIGLAALGYRWRFVAVFLSPMMSALKAAPVASYIILCLLLLPSRMLPVITSFMMALPVIYTNVLNGLHNTDPKLLEMAKVFDMRPMRKVVYIYFSQTMPFLVTACNVALGLCWKAGIAAEVIGITRGSIGEKMYEAKVFVDTKSVLAWTVVVIVISLLCEKAFLVFLKRITALVERR